MVLMSMDIHILRKPPMILLKKKEKTGIPSQSLLSSSSSHMTHASLLNLPLIIPSNLFAHLPLNGSNFLLLLFSGCLNFPCFHLFQHLCTLLPVLNFLYWDTWIKLCFLYLTQIDRLHKPNLQIHFKHDHRKQIMSFGTGHLINLYFLK